MTYSIGTGRTYNELEPLGIKEGWNVMLRYCNNDQFFRTSSQKITRIGIPSLKITIDS